MRSPTIDSEELQYFADSHFRSEWDELYQTDGLTDWELLPADDLVSTLSRVIDQYGRPSTALDIGCGRGLRTLAAVLGLEPLNTESFRLRGIDHSRTAIGAANAFANLLRRRQPLPGVFGAHMASILPAGSGGLRASVKFEAADLFDWLRTASDLPVDLVIDWMCLHEIQPNERFLYAELLARACKRCLVLNTFSVEGSTVHGLGCVGDRIPKYQLSCEEVTAIFGEHFSIEYRRMVPEDLNPAQRPSDNIVAAKCIYVMERMR